MGKQRLSRTRFYIVLDQSWNVAAVALMILTIRRIFGQQRPEKCIEGYIANS